MTAVSIIGLGKLGSPMAAVYASKGFRVIGVDKNSQFVDDINNGKAPVEEPQLQEYINKGRSNLTATLGTEQAILESDVTFIIVPTPSGPDGTFTNKYVLEAIKEIGAALRKKTSYHLVVVTSTVMPGSTNGEICQALEEASGRKVGKHLGLCYSPEFIALGSVVQDMLNPDFFLIGESDKKAGDLLESIYSRSCDNQPRMQRMNCVNAELTKISVNTFVTTKISYANMLSEICDYLEGADVDVVTDAVGCDSRIGKKYLRGAVAYGGPCFPRDNIAFSKLAQNLTAKCDLSIATDVINKNQKERVLKIIENLKNRPRTIGILGLSYKPGTPVIEESQGIALALALLNKGYKVVAYDPMALAPVKSILGDKVSYGNSTQDVVNQSDALVIMTAWPEFSSVVTKELENKPSSYAVIDCWRVINKEKYPGKKVIYLGTGFLASPKEEGLCNVSHT